MKVPAKLHNCYPNHYQNYGESICHRKDKTASERLSTLEKHEHVYRTHQKQLNTPRDKVIPHGIPGKPWEVCGSDVFTMNNTNLFCVKD